jgi:hypothetical protein
VARDRFDGAKPALADFANEFRDHLDNPTKKAS